jgi:chromosome segregation ATPase
MNMKATVVATLLGCTMLVGCKGSDDKADDATKQSTSTFAAEFAALKQDNAVLKTDNASLKTASEANKTQTEQHLASLQATVEQLTSALAGTAKQQDVADLQAKLANVDLTKISALSDQITELSSRLAALEKNPQLTEADRTHLNGLADQLKKLKDDIAAAAKATDLATAAGTINQLLEGLKTKADATTINALAADIAKLQAALDTATTEAAKLSTRIAALEGLIKK